MSLLLLFQGAKKVRRHPGEERFDFKKEDEEILTIIIGSVLSGMLDGKNESD
jgi:hypothetical protein